MLQSQSSFQPQQLACLDGYTFTSNNTGTLECVDLSRALNPFMGRIISVVGHRLGDEGKGRTVEEILQDLIVLTNRKDPVAMMLKAQGGSNSGHTVYDDNGNKYAFNLVPAGVVNKDIRYLALGADVLADPLKIHWEGVPLEQRGFDFWKRLVIDERTMMADISHRIRDLAREATRSNPLGSTGRGIAPGYEDQGAKDHISYSVFKRSKEEFANLMRERLTRCCLRVKHEYGLKEAQWGKIFDYDPPKESGEAPGLKQRELLANQNWIDAGFFKKSEFDLTRFKGEKPFELNIERIIDEYWEAGQRVKDNIVNVGDLVLKILDTTNQYVISEHGQALGLDVLHGDSPFTTSSVTGSSIVPHTARFPVTQPVHVVLVCKAYETAVGTHLLPTQIPPTHPLAQILLPQEKGATTGRQRWVSWPCCVQMAEALRQHGAHDFVINKIDQLTLKGDWQGPLRICVGYKTPQGTIVKRLPEGTAARKKLTPIYLDMPGWSEDISGVRSFADLPANAQRYIATLYKVMVDIANRELQSEALQQLPYIPTIGVGPKPGEVVRNIPRPQSLVSLAYACSVTPETAELITSEVPSLRNEGIELRYV